MAPSPRHQLMQQLAAVREALRAHRIRDAADYAEVLVAEALGGRRKKSGVNKGFDVVTLSHGRIEVKCRQLPPDGRIEERVALSASKCDGFDHLAIVIFHPDFQIKGAVLVPYRVVWAFIRAHKYHRIKYARACRLAGAIDITAQVVAAAQR